MSPAPVHPLSLTDAAALVGGRVAGPGDLVIDGVAPLRSARASQLALVASRRYLAEVAGSGAGALLVASEFEEAVATDPRPKLVVADPHAALVPLLGALHPEPAPVAGVHPTAVLGHGVRLGEGVSVGPYAVLGADAVIGDGARIGAHVVVGDGVSVGPDCILHPQVVLYPGTRLGARVIVHSGARLGVDGFGYAWSDGGHRRVPHVGGCVIHDDVEIGANTCIDRGSLGDTEVGHGVKLDNLVHLAHNVRVGEHTAMAALVGIAGSTEVGRGVLFGGQAGVVGHVEVGDGARIASAAAVMKSVPAGETFSGHPARPNREFLRAQAHVARLERLLARIDELEAEVGRLRDRYITGSDS